MAKSNPHWNCSQWTDEDTSEFIQALLVGPIIGIVLGLIMSIVASLPLCFGVMKAHGKIIAIIGILIGFVAILMPLFLSFGSCTSFVDGLCASCKTDDGGNSCDEPDPWNQDGKTVRQQFDDACGALGVLLVYLAGYGWAAVVLGIVAAALSCCILCGCCKMKDEESFQDGGAQTSA